MTSTVLGVLSFGLVAATAVAGSGPDARTPPVGAEAPASPTQPSKPGRAVGTVPQQPGQRPAASPNTLPPGPAIHDEDEGDDEDED